MTASTSLSVFCQWLLAEPTSPVATCAITIHGDESAATDLLINEIAEYLNEYDEEADGLWLSATDELVEKVAEDPSNRRLLGLPDLAPGESSDQPEQFIAALEALSKKGHMVFRWPKHDWNSPSPSRTFHAGVGTCQSVQNRCHIIVDPELVARSSIAHIIGDVFLEWMLAKSSSQQPLQSLR